MRIKGKSKFNSDDDFVQKYNTDKRRSRNNFNYSLIVSIIYCATPRHPPNLEHQSAIYFRN